MAEPLRVYDEDDSEQPVTRPNLRALEGGSQGDGVPSGQLQAAGDHTSTAPPATNGSTSIEGLGTAQGAITNSTRLQDAENRADPGSWYNPHDPVSLGARARGWLKGNRRKAAVGAVVTGGVISLIAGAFLSLNPLKLSNFMENVEATAFGRYQVDLNGRSSKWLQTYMILRLGEVEDPKLAPQDRQNLLFRADKVDNNKPLTDWYRTMRASKFEQDVFGKQGIKFTSMAKWDANKKMYIIRPAKVTINDQTLEVGFGEGNLKPGGDLTKSEFNALSSADINNLNGRLSNFIEVTAFGNDKEARTALKQVVNENYKGWWNAVKRYHIRRDIQNMIGVRSWSFFENTRSNAREKTISIRNKIVAQMLPEDTKSGKFIQCLFGISNCKSTVDPADPAGQALPPDGTSKEGDKTCDSSCPKDEQGKTLGDGTGEATLSEGAADTADLLNKMASKVVAKAGLLSLLDSLARFDASLHNHSLSKLVTQAKKAQAAGLFTVFAVASDQLKTGQVSSSEVNDFMNAFGNPTNSAGWRDVISPASSSSSVSAASQDDAFTPAKDEQTFCSQQHQDEIAQPQNYLKADQEFQYLCPQYKVGATGNNATTLESAWDNGPGLVLHPILAAYHAATGGIFNVFNQITGAITGFAINSVLSALHLTGDIQQLSAWVATKALVFFGGGPMINDTTPSGQVANVALEGGAVVAEATAREQGASLTTPETSVLATKNYLAYQSDRATSAGWVDRYFSLANPGSLLSRQLFSLSNFSLAGLRTSATNLFSSAVSKPIDAMAVRAHAQADDPYAAAKFSGIETFDFPSQCLNTDPLNMTPQDATNADELGIFKPQELTWDLMNNKEAWYAALYNKVNGDEDKAMEVWNCALLDNAVRTGLGALYGYKGEDALAY